MFAESQNSFFFFIRTFAEVVFDVIGVVDNVEEKPSSKNVVFDLKDLSYWRESRETPYPAIILTQAKIKVVSDVIGVVDNVEEKPSSKNVVFDLKDLSYWRESRETPYPAIILTQAKIKVVSGFIDGEEDPMCFPEDLDVLLGCTLAFKVKPQGNNRPASVMRVSTDREIIGHISSILGQTQVIKIVEAKENCSNELQLHKEKSIAIEVGKRMICIHTHTGSSFAMELAECGDNATCDLSYNVTLHNIYIPSYSHSC
ncbi:hypothetical protein DEO72_LG2g2290 [Vigna unguiculata]|uniref:Nucleic acid-binding n=1 Tax=Vigna unguiculata TaxID=3917 RepID=A0A4D6KW17_VIGUN|nr:hypothetical protein DEO72_LG2g2290 [Vigna unguiculata]